MSPQAAEPAPVRAPFDRSTEDVGNIVEFGHVNICVPDQQLALAFHVSGLGLTRDPYLNTGLDNAWINVGSCQFHLPAGPAQVLRGTVGLVMPDLDGLMARLAAVRSRLQGTRFAFERCSADEVAVSCPWGNRLRVHAPDRARFGSLRLGMPYVELDCPAGSAAGIARFYAAVLGAPARMLQTTTERSVRIAIGLSESLVFKETTQPLPAYDGHHVQIAVADFSGVHRRLLGRGLVSEESNQSQYRFEDIVDPDTGERLLQLEHEVRSMRHPMYARPLVNRDPAITTRHYAPGHEAMRTRLGPSESC